MHRVDTSTAAPSLPATDPVGTPGYFTKGDPGGGTLATVPGQDWFNAVQEELAYVITQAGIALSKADRTQLYQAVAAMIDAGDFVHLTGPETITGLKSLTAGFNAGSANQMQVNNAGKMTAGTVPLERMGSVVLNGSGIYGPGDFWFVLGTDFEAVYVFRIVSNSGSKIYYASNAPAGDSGASAATIQRQLAGGSQNNLFLHAAVNTAFIYKVWKLTET